MRYVALSVAVMIASVSLPCAAWAKEFMALIEATQSDSKINGIVLLTEKKSGVLIEASVNHLAPGKHGFHVHENGSCADAGKAAGGHFNPDHTQHGYMPKKGMAHSHPGDMGNLDAGPDGHAVARVFLKGVTLKEGKYAVLGKAIIVHENADDFSQPTGNAGGRVACGLIEEKP